MIDDLCRHTLDLIAKAGTKPVRGGVSIGGPLDAEKGIIYSPPNLPGWDAIPLRDQLSRRLEMPMFIAHDGGACALAETWWGAGRGSRRVVYLTCGTGFGMGFVCDGKVYYGSRGQSVEIGHVRYREEGPDAYGKPGCFEGFCAGGSLGRLAAWRFPQRWKDRPPTSEEVSGLAQSGDRDAQEIIDLNARGVGDACAMLGDMLSPDVILLGSLARYLGMSWIEKIRARFAAECLASNAKSCRIEPAGLGERLQDCSALVVAVAGE